MLFDFNEPAAFLKRAQVRLRELPPIVSDWKAPTYFPELRGASCIAIDTETKELDFDRGPGWGRGMGHIVGVSVAAMWSDWTFGKWYFPVRHEVEPEDNCEPANVFAWLRDMMATPHIPKIGANLVYDIGWLGEESIDVHGELIDVQYSEALLDENGHVNLDFLGSKYRTGGKTTSELYQWLAKAYGGNPTGDQRKNIWRAPPRLVGPYGEDDALQPILIYMKQADELRKQELLELLRMECRAIPLLIKMRRQGVKIDMDYAQQLYDELERDIPKLYAALAHKHGCAITGTGPKELTRLFQHLQIPVPGSFNKNVLKAIDHQALRDLAVIKEHETIRNTFVRSYLLEGNTRGLIHCTFHPLKSEDGGAKTGRYASSDPNLQNIPIRTALGGRVRKAFVARYKHWEKNDHSQIEYRMLANFAVGPGAEQLRKSYNDDPTTDYHEYTQTNVKNVAGVFIERRPIKNINFGLVYGQTEKSLAKTAGFTPEQARAVFKAYHEGAPYVRPTMAAIGMEVQTYGYIRTILNRRVRFDLYEPASGDRRPGLPLEQAYAMYGPNIKRAYEYRGVNYKLQGSAADCIKKGMVDCFVAGVFDVTGVPMLQVHDELDLDVIDDSPEQNEAYAEMRHILETCVPALKIPLKVDHKRGPSWGDID